MKRTILGDVTDVKMDDNIVLSAKFHEIYSFDGLLTHEELEEKLSCYDLNDLPEWYIVRDEDGRYEGYGMVFVNEDDGSFFVDVMEHDFRVMLTVALRNVLKNKNY